MKTHSAESKKRKQAILDLLHKDAYTVSDLMHLSQIRGKMVEAYLDELRRADLIHACEDIVTQLGTRVLVYKAGALPLGQAQVRLRRETSTHGAVLRMLRLLPGLLPISKTQLKYEFGVSDALITKLRECAVERGIAANFDLREHGSVMDEILHPIADAHIGAERVASNYVRHFYERAWRPQRLLPSPVVASAPPPARWDGDKTRKPGRAEVPESKRQLVVKAKQEEILKALKEPLSAIELGNLVGVYYSSLDKYLRYLESERKVHVVEWRLTVIGTYVPVWKAGKADELSRPKSPSLATEKNLSAYFDKIQALVMPLLPIETNDLIYGLGMHPSRVKTLIQYWQRKGLITQHALVVRGIRNTQVLFPATLVADTDLDRVQIYQRLRTERKNELWRANAGTHRMINGGSHVVNPIVSRKDTHESPWVHGGLTNHLNVRFF